MIELSLHNVFWKITHPALEDLFEMLLKFRCVYTEGIIGVTKKLS